MENTCERSVLKSGTKSFSIDQLRKGKRGVSGGERGVSGGERGVSGGERGVSGEERGVSRGE